MSPDLAEKEAALKRSVADEMARITPGTAAHREDQNAKAKAILEEARKASEGAQQAEVALAEQKLLLAGAETRAAKEEARRDEKALAKTRLLISTLAASIEKLK